MNDEAEIDNEDFSFFSGQTPTFRNGPNAAMQSNPHEWQDAILTELASQASNTGEAAAILDCIEELAESLLVPHSNPMSPEELSVLICEILELERRNLQKKVIPEKLLSDSLSIVAMQSTRWILRHIMEYYLETLSGLYPDIEFWKGRLRVRKPLRDLLEQGPENWFRPLLGLPYKGRSSLAVLYRHRPDYPRLILRSFRTGIKPLMFSVNISGRIDIQEKVARLYDLKKTLLRKAGLLHHHSFRLGQVPSSDVSQWFEPILDLNRMCCDTEPSNIHSTPDALKALNTILIGLPEMKKRLEQSRNELRRPGHFRRHWLAYTISGIASVYCGRKIYVHRAAIKVLLDRARKVASDFWIEHVSVPLHAIHRRLTRPRLPTLKRTELAEERKTLEIMLREFGMEQLTRNAKLVPPGVSREMFIKQIEKQAALGDMTMVLDSYRNDISKPIYALAAGDLLRCILIQLQKLKVDLEESLFELDEMLEQNEITIELASIVPALLTTLPIVLIMLYQASKLSKADTTSYRAIRRSIHSIHRLLICNYPLDSSKGFETVEDSGKILTHVHRIGKRAIHLRGQKMMSHSAFLLLRKDIKRLISLDFTIEQKRLLIERMYSVHAFLAI